MRTIPLSGKKAAGRVALVDDEDYDLVIQYRWNVHEMNRGGGRPTVVYARAKPTGSRGFFIHNLVMGSKGVDHRDHDGLNNQRYNLRVATVAQNNHNQRPQVGKSSQYKGVGWNKAGGLWMARIRINKISVYLGRFASELEAAYAYDAAARGAFGAFACTNFPEGPTLAMRDEWTAETSARAARAAQERERVCIRCGKSYQVRWLKPSYYCSKPCRTLASQHRKRERELEGRLF